jgi:hypothetical protein
MEGRVAANIVNKQLRTADRGWSSSLGVGHGTNKKRTASECEITVPASHMRIRQGVVVCTEATTSTVTCLRDTRPETSIFFIILSRGME